jgi:hypothetical protein
MDVSGRVVVCLADLEMTDAEVKVRRQREQAVLRAYLLGCWLHHRLMAAKVGLAEAYDLLLGNVDGGKSVASEALEWLQNRAERSLFGNEEADDEVESPRKDMWKTSDIFSNLQPEGWRYQMEEHSQ